jgi:hypothetical protein
MQIIDQYLCVIFTIKDSYNLIIVKHSHSISHRPSFWNSEVMNFFIENL